MRGRPGTDGRSAWNAAFDERGARLVRRVCDGAADHAAREAAWRELITLIGPHLERWAQRSFVLRRCRLASEDDARAVLVGALSRLRADDFANLRAYLERRDPGDDLDRVETDTLARLARLSAVAVDGPSESAIDAAAADDRDRTPLRAWLVTLVGYAIKDHVRQRLGCAHRADEAGGSKRDVNTDAERYQPGDEGGERPPITDYLTMARFLEEVGAFIAAFPDDMRLAINLWLDDLGYDEIARRLGGAMSEKRARDLVRAAKARLREQFRGDWERFTGMAA